MLMFGMTNPGLRRSNNEDAFVVKSELGFCALADGMGGAAAGEIASRIFIETVIEVFSILSQSSGLETSDLVHRAFQLSNEKILINTQKNSAYQGMGCTAELLAFNNHQMILGHVGDSRTYLYRANTLKRITQDHSLVQEQIDKGMITPSEAKQHSLRHVILRAVGIKEDIEVDIIRGKALPGDIFLLCSDGLTDMIDDSLILETLSFQFDITQKAGRLIELANEAGGYDNVTVVLCEIPIP